MSSLSLLVFKSDSFVTDKDWKLMVKDVKVEFSSKSTGASVKNTSAVFLTIFLFFKYFQPFHIS